jgi:hypothetical protein
MYTAGDTIQQNRLAMTAKIRYPLGWLPLPYTCPYLPHVLLPPEALPSHAP